MIFELRKHFGSKAWPCMWAILMAIGWLLPNHFPPWASFHLDAWIAAMCAVAVLVGILCLPNPVPFHGIALAVLGMACIPMLQFAAGLVTSSGVAWINTSYLLGFCIALLAGAWFEAARPARLIGWLCLAVCLAAFFSVLLQLSQWLMLEGFATFSMGGGTSRPYANIGQPNQLSTLLLWGVLAVGWAYIRAHLGGVGATILAAYLLLGVALTQSRTAWVAIVVLLALAWYWRKHWPSRQLPWIGTLLAVWFFALVALIPALGRFLLLRSDAGGMESIVRASGELRHIVWAVFLDAAWHKPWVGYGWSQISAAQSAVAIDHPALGVYFAHSHNLFIDFILWCGIPMGLLISAWILRWGWCCFRGVRSATDAVLLMLVMVVFNHAMFEFPLHYAYFLLPTGFVMGALDVRCGKASTRQIGRSTLSALWLGDVVLYCVLVRDYLKVEEQYRALRFEWAHIKTAPAQRPDVWLLTQWSDFYDVVRFTPGDGVRESDIEWLRTMAVRYASPALYLNLAKSLAFTGRSDEARQWLRRACKMVPPGQCKAIYNAWAALAANDVRLAVVRWTPEEAGSVPTP